MTNSIGTATRPRGPAQQRLRSTHISALLLGQRSRTLGIDLTALNRDVAELA
ncbi:hypothetical protein [Nocardia sp. NPDC057668]|uniref:hypothetical protein n=1 Tax=Nocardia sp. NPDC057668 TaxID=3346202 RepID=UPI003670A7D7